MTSNTLDTRVAVKALREALEHVRPALLDASQEPLCLTAAGGTLTMRVRNGHIAAEATLPAECTGSLTTQVNGVRMDAVVRGLTPGSVVLGADDRGLHFKSGTFVARLNRDEHDAYPSLEPSGVVVQVHGNVLHVALDAVAYAQCKDDKRDMLNGIHVYASDAKVYTVATDGHRLARALVADGGLTAAAILPLLADGPFTVDRLAVPALLHALDTPDMVRVGRDKGRIWVGRECGTWWATLLESRYPDVAQVIPAGGGTTVKVGADVLADLALRVGLVHGTTSTIKVDANSMRLTCVSPEVGEASEDVDAAVENAREDGRVSVNILYLRDALAQMAEEPTVEVGVGDGLTAITLRGGDHTAVIMPMRV